MEFLTGSGRIIDLKTIEAADIDLDVMARSLSNICRFTGHTKSFYSVALHSINVAFQLSEDIAIYGLLHDCHESFLGDITRPVRAVIGNRLQAIEQRIDRAVYAAVGVAEPSKETLAEVTKADNLILQYEMLELMNYDQLSVFSPKLKAPIEYGDCSGLHAEEFGQWLSTYSFHCERVS